MNHKTASGVLTRAVSRAQSLSSDFDLNPETILPPGRKLRPAAVLIPILFENNTARVILTKRASGMKHHAGQISFPGGKTDPGDADSIATALREAQEEIALSPDQVDVIGALPEHETVTAFSVTPVVGLIDGPFHPRPEPGEVSEVFSVPLEHLLDRKNYIVQSRIWQRRERFYYTVPWGPWYIWGATARILRNLAESAPE